MEQHIDNISEEGVLSYVRNPTYIIGVLWLGFLKMRFNINEIELRGEKLK